MPQDGLPLTRVLVGPKRTDAPYDQVSSDQETLFKLNNDDDKNIREKRSRDRRGTLYRTCVFIIQYMMVDSENLKLTN